jgi:hypothetical protein
MFPLSMRTKTLDNTRRCAYGSAFQDRRLRRILDMSLQYSMGIAYDPNGQSGIRPVE